MKKIAVLLSTILASTFILSGCSSASKSSAQGSGAGDKTAGETYELKYAFPVNGQIPKDMQEVIDEVNKITMKKINVKVVAAPISNAQYTQQINLMISGGEKLDLMTERGFNLTGDVAKNQLMPIDSLLKSHGQEVVKSLGDYIKAGQVNGKQYAVPAIRNMANAYGICMRKDILDKYSIDPTKIKTLDDVEAVFKKVQAGEPNLIMTMSQSSGTSLYSYMYPIDALGDGFGVLPDFGKSGLKVVNHYATPEYANAVKFIRRWYDQGYIMKDNATNTQAGPATIKAGKAFSFFTSLKPGYDIQASNSCGTEMVSSTLIPGYSTTDGVAGYSMSIPVGTKNPEKVMQFMNLMYSDPQVINLFDWGIEGKHYTKVSGANNVIDYPNGITATTTGYGLNMGFQFGNQLLSYVWKGDSPDLYTKLADFNKSATLSKAFGFLFNGASVKTEFAALTNVNNQYKIALEDGMLDPDTTLPKYISALKDAGIEKYIAEKQKQLDEWVKTQGK